MPMNILPDDRYAMTTTNASVGSGPGSVEDGGGGAGNSMHTGTDGSNLPARNVVADSANGSPAKSFKHDTSAGSGHHSHSHHQHQQHPPIASQDFARIPTGSGSDELYRSLTGIGGGGGAARPDLHRNPYRMSEGGGGGYGQVYPMENRYNMPISSHSGSYDSSSGSTFPRLNPLQGIHGYPSLQVGSGGSSTSTPISADRQTAHDVGIGMGMRRAYDTPFALPGLHSSSVAESRIPPHMEQIAGSSQGLIQLPLPPSMHPQDHSATGAGYGGRVTPMVSLLNDNKPTAVDAGSALPPPPIDPGQPGTGTSPAAGTDSPGHGSTSSSRAHGGGLALRADASSTSTGSNGGGGGATSGGNPTRGSSPPIRPIEIRRFPFLSPAIGGESSAVVGGRARSGLTPASLPNILNLATTASTSGGSGSSERSKGNTELSMGDRLGGSAGLSSPHTSKHQPSKFSSLHHMVADVPPEDESEYEEYEDDADDASSGDEASGRTTRTTTINLSASAAAGAGAGGAPVGGIPMQEYAMERKRKRRKLDPGGASGGAGGMEEEDDSARLFREDPVSVGHVTEHQARELFAIFISELNTALPLLDPVIHTFGKHFVRDTSPFLLSTTLCVASRFLRGGPETTPELVTSIPPEKARAVHESCLRLARQQMQLTFQHAVSTLEIVQAITLLSIWKEPDDDKAGFYFNRAVVMAKELHLGRIERSRPRTADEAHWRRIRHRFNQILQITHEDPLVANSFDWHIGSNLPLVDLSLIASVQLRARFLHYKSLLEITAADADDLERTDQSHTATLLSLSILTRTSNQDLGNINAHWVEQIREASVTGDIPIKPFIWLAGLRLHLNIVIMNQTIRIENSRRLQRNSLGSIAAFHHSINAACEVLTKMKMLPKRQLAFASDTLLHFTIYAGYFLFTASTEFAWFSPAVCTKSTRDLLEPEERQHCEDIVIGASQALANASLYPADAPALHARFLRRLTSPYLPPQDTLDSANGTRATHGNSDNNVDSRDLQQQAPPHLHHQPDYNTLPPDYDNAALANGFQLAQESGLPSNIPLADTIWGGTDDGLWTQFDGAWWDHVMQDMTAKNAAKPMSSITNLQPPT
ncbi:hypothetical protein QFC21_005379 [Naganishia friedmannii]|uniref:Uncharacterized protein n=1 Tax=Naganishia friedmannii TaxID=89922 RepID=A0ACC2VAR8_9TREE|nr:hypothetical protein QFC21_005379 [Naganishia friedmannii]